MAIVTIGFCPACKWRSSSQPGAIDCAGLPCPTCGNGISSFRYDPAYTGTLMGRPYVEANALAPALAAAGVSPVEPATNVPLPLAVSAAPPISGS